MIRTLLELLRGRALRGAPTLAHVRCVSFEQDSGVLALRYEIRSNARSARFVTLVASDLADDAPADPVIRGVSTIRVPGGWSVEFREIDSLGTFDLLLPLGRSGRLAFPAGVPRVLTDHSQPLAIAPLVVEAVPAGLTIAGFGPPGRLLQFFSAELSTMPASAERRGDAGFSWIPCGGGWDHASRESLLVLDGLLLTVWRQLSDVVGTAPSARLHLQIESAGAGFYSRHPERVLVDVTALEGTERRGELNASLAWQLTAAWWGAAIRLRGAEAEHLTFALRLAMHEQWMRGVAGGSGLGTGRSSAIDQVRRRLLEPIAEPDAAWYRRALQLLDGIRSSPGGGSVRDRLRALTQALFGMEVETSWVVAQLGGGS